MAEPGSEARKTGSRVYAMQYYILVADIKEEVGRRSGLGTERWGSKTNQLSIHGFETMVPISCTLTVGCANPF